MSNPAARVSDMVLHDSPHCHAPIHPSSPVPTPIPHPVIPLPITNGASTVKIGGLFAARTSDQTAPCALLGCIPAGPGLINGGSATVRIEGLPAARVGDSSSHPTCIGPIPSPTGKIISPGCPTVIIG